LRNVSQPCKGEFDLDTPLCLCALDDIPDGGSKGFTLGKHNSIFAVRQDRCIYIYRNTCPHAGLELNWTPDRFLDRDREYILCSSHGALFNIASGFCIAGPCAGSELTRVDFEIIENRIYLQL
jgi:naringenin degradation protein FdeD